MNWWDLESKEVFPGLIYLRIEKLRYKVSYVIWCISPMRIDYVKEHCFSPVVEVTNLRPTVLYGRCESRSKVSVKCLRHEVTFGKK